MISFFLLAILVWNANTEVDIAGYRVCGREGGQFLYVCVDVGDITEYDLWDEVEAAMHQELLGDDLDVFRAKLNEADKLLYLADNVGETVFDRVLIESLEVPVIYAVKSGPILNDTTVEDARAAGIDQIAQIIETGTQSPGIDFSQCSTEFRKLFEESEIILAKGQGNFCSLDEMGDNIFFLLRVKCPMLSRYINVPEGSLVFIQGTTTS